MIRGFVGFAPLLATCIAVAALGVSVLQFDQYRRAVRDQSISDVLNRSTQILMWASSDPEAFSYFEKDIFASGGRRGLDDLKRADRMTRVRVQLICETLADFFESTYDQRASFEADDWQGWCSYMAQLYDESPALQEFLRRRADWYEVDEALAELSVRRIARSR